MNQQPPTVLIVGSGPSGLVLALALLQNGIPVRIIEKNFTPRLGQRGAGIMPRSLELFSHLRILDEVMKHAIHVPPTRRYKMPDGIQVDREFSVSPHLDPTPTHPFLNPMLLGQDRLERIFHSYLAQLGCAVEKGTELVSFKQFPDHVEVNLIRRGPNGDKEEHETSRYAWMVGTDGAKGVVRKQLGLSFLGETRTVENFVVGDICVEGLGSKHWHMWGDASTTLISLRPTETPGLFNFVIAGKNINYSEIAETHDTIRAAFRRHLPLRTDIKFGEIPWKSYYTPNIRMVDNFRKGRVLIAGDAGHVHSVTGGQGMNTGIQDSFNLAWKLSLVLKGLASPSLLDSYTEERIPVIAEMLNQTTKLLKSTFEDKDDRSWQRGGGLNQLGVNYRWSSIVMDERKALELEREAEEDAYLEDFDFYDNSDEKIDSYGHELDGRLRAGDRAPDSCGLLVLRESSASGLRDGKTTLFKIFGPSYHTALIFADHANCDAVLNAVARYPPGVIKTAVIVKRKRPPPTTRVPADYVLEDRDGHAHEAYMTDLCGVVLVRPDGIVGAILQGPNSLHRYFKRLLAP